LNEHESKKNTPLCFEQGTQKIKHSMVEEVNMHQQKKNSRTFVHAWMFEDFQVARFRHDRQQPPVFGDVARVGVAPLFVGPHALRAPPAGSREGFPFFVFQIGSTTGCVEIGEEIKTRNKNWSEF